MSSNSNSCKEVKYIKGVHRHGSETFLIISKDKKSSCPNGIYKTATTQAGIKSIISEHEGICWYNERNKNKIICEIKKHSNNYFRIKIIPSREFFNIDSDVKYQSQKKYFDLTINHYIQIWHDYKDQEYAPLHGDLSLVGNVMFNSKNEVLFVDWEQFEKNRKIPTGLDPMMLLLENVWYEIIRSNRIDIMVLKHFVNSLHTLDKARLLSPLLLVNPAKSTLNFIKSNTDIWNGQHNKLPVLRLSERNILEIDKAVSKMKG
jgi:hypothetical protein